MSKFQARALYDFKGEPNTAEMSISAGEILTVLRTDVGEGWWEGLNSNGVSGLFPEAYVEKIDNSYGPPAMPAPVLPPTTDNNWGNTNQISQDNEEWDDDWDNDDTYTEVTPKPNEHIYGNEPNLNQFVNKPSELDVVSESNFGQDNKGTVTKKSLNRFSTFVKSGAESYILGTSPKIYISESLKIQIIQLDEGYYTWPVNSNPYTVQVTSPKKEKKLKGLKNFTAYQLTPSFSNIAVSRRYKHFDWLHERMMEKFNLIAVPPLPDKQISGRFEADFIEHRRVQLQEFVDYVCRHPVLSQAEVWQHFITCTDEKLWKQGKRKAEKDELVGANFCLCLEVPDRELLPTVVDPKIEQSANFINTLDIAVKNMIATATDQGKKHQGAYQREYSKIGESFINLGAAIEYAEKVPSELATGIKRIGVAYHEIAKIFVEQPKIDWEPLGDKLYLYKGITSTFPDIFAIHKGAQQKKRECERLNMAPAQLTEVRKRTDVLTYAIFAELNHFKSERDTDLKMAMKRFVEEQINFYKKIVYTLENTLKSFD